MKQPYLLALILAIGASSVDAVEAPPDNGVAVLSIFTAQGLPAENFLSDVVPMTDYFLYFVLYHPEGTGDIAGVEFRWRLDPEIARDNDWQFNSDSWINSGDDYNIRCGFWPGIPVEGDHAYIGSLRLYFRAPVGPTHLFLEPTDDYQYIPGEMAYDRWPEQPLAHIMVPYSEGFSHDHSVFEFNAQPVVIDAATWSDVKSLFD